MVGISGFGAAKRYDISSESLSVSVMDYGAACLSIRINGKELTLGLDTYEAYLADRCHLGVVVGRYGNRIAGSRGFIDGREIRLVPNEGRNQLHGGPDSMDRKMWKAVQTEDTPDGGKVRLECFSPDGESGFPGNLTAAVTYTVKGSKLMLEFEGECDGDTFYAPTTHMYFSLGEPDTILGTNVLMKADRYLPVDEEKIPTGILPVDEYFDFRVQRPVKNPYDHCFVIEEAAGADEPVFTAETGSVKMTLRTDYPALQFYTGTKLRSPHHAFQGFAIEPEMYPDSPNHPEFPSAVLRAGEHYHRFVEYTFAEI